MWLVVIVKSLCRERIWMATVVVEAEGNVRSDGWVLITIGMCNSKVLPSVSPVSVWRWPDGHWIYWTNRLNATILQRPSPSSNSVKDRYSPVKTMDQVRPNLKARFRLVIGSVRNWPAINRPSSQRPAVDQRPVCPACPSVMWTAVRFVCQRRAVLILWSWKSAMTGNTGKDVLFTVSLCPNCSRRRLMMTDPRPTPRRRRITFSHVTAVWLLHYLFLLGYEGSFSLCLSVTTVSPRSDQIFRKLTKSYARQFSYVNHALGFRVVFFTRVNHQLSSTLKNDEKARLARPGILIYYHFLQILIACLLHFVSVCVSDCLWTFISQLSRSDEVI